MTATDAAITMADAYARHGVALTRFATGLVGPSDAADVVSDALARLLTSPVWAEARDHRAVLYRAVLWEARMHHRSTGRRRAREHRASAPRPTRWPTSARRWRPPWPPSAPSRGQ
ncbi:MAG: hypothetical protein R2761_19585 [Acidimicrobiales bacterium]